MNNINRLYLSYLDFAVETAYLAGRLTLGYFRGDTQTEFKEDDTPVTLADRKAEEFITHRISSKYSDHCIVGEEFGVSPEGQNKSHKWIIDPIDGTKSFIHGVPLYGVLIGLEIEGTVEVGVVYFPATDEMVAAATGHGCRLNGRPVRVSQVTSLDRATVAFTDPASFAKYNRGREWEKIQKAAWLCAGWGDAYGHCLVATGKIELMLDPVMKLWDCAPFPPILREAGGCFGNWEGTSTIYGGEAMSTTNDLRAEVLELFSTAQKP